MKDSVKRMEEIADQFDKWLARADPLNVFAMSHGFARACWIDAHGGGSTFLAPEARAMTPAVYLSLRTVLNHIEPGWENCQAVAAAWLAEQPLPSLPQVNEP